MEQSHIPILKAFDELKFNLGKKTLIDFIKGDPNPTIDRNNLDELNAYGCLYMMDKTDLFKVVDILISKGYLEYKILSKGFQVVQRTPKGTKEIYERKFTVKLDEAPVVKVKQKFEETKITDDDKKLFQTFDFFLGKYNDEQKKAIISDNSNILCIAGAGSGKTTVLTKRIEFLTKFRGFKQNKILAITFTRKAKKEMQHRLNENGILNVEIETFNSFCEKLLKRYGEDKLYKKEVEVAAYKDKIAVVNHSMKKLGIRFDMFYDDYFTKKQIREKSPDELFFIFVNDIFSVIDYYKNYMTPMKHFYERETNSTKKRIAKIVHDIAKESEKELKKRALRDFSDQINDTIQLFEMNPQLIPKYEHVLVDEFQDVNYVQYKMLKMLNAPNTFAVGDPRQAIYGWRGSEIKYILNFQKDFKDTQVIQLKRNYRSTKQIVDFSNQCIKNMGLVDLLASNEKEKDCIYLVEQSSEILEKRFVLEAIKNSTNPRNEIFVLARTNRILENFAEFFAQQGIKYTIKSEEEYKNGEPKEDEIVLATVHSIKGMEAKEVYVISANSISFPNKVQDNFVLALMKEDDDYDKDAEELRLFYVAISRAKEKLVITYTGNYTKFINSDMASLCDIKEKNKNIFQYATSVPKNLDTSNGSVLKVMLKEWRAQKSKETGLPTYMILSNNAIEDLVKLRPSSKIAMHNVNGLGEMKIAKYGDELLKIIGN